MEQQRKDQAYRKLVLKIMENRKEEDLLPIWVAEIMIVDALIKSVSKVLNKPERAEMIVRLRFGLDKEKLTLQKTQNIMGITGGRIRQIEKIMIRRLSHPRYRKFLNPFFEAPQLENRETEAKEELAAADKYGKLSLDQLELSVRAYNVLWQNRIKTLGELRQKTEKEIMHFNNSGRKTLNELRHILSMYSMRFSVR